MLYFSIAFLLLFFSFRYDICKKTKNKELWYRVMLLIFILTAGLRWRLGGDTARGIYVFYHETPYIFDLSMDDLGNYPFVTILLSLVYSFVGRYYVFQLIESVFVNILLFKYIRKHTPYIFACVFFYYVAEYFYMNMEIMKAAFSIVICLFANDYFIERKWLKAYLLIIFAILFHPQAIVVAITPLFLFLKTNRYGLIVLLLFYVLGIVIQKTMGDYLFLLGGDDLSDKIVLYGQSRFSEAPILIEKIKGIYPIILYSAISAIFVKYKSSEVKLNILQPFFMIGMIFLILQLNTRIFYRIAEMYRIYLFLYISYTAVEIIHRRGRNVFSVAYVRSAILFFPLVLSLISGIIVTPGRQRYYPYTTIFNRVIYDERERAYHNEDISEFSIAQINQY